MLWKLLIVLPALVLLAGVVTFALLSLLARKPAHLGATDGKLAPCPDSPNCVCSQATDDGHRIEPLPYQGDPAEVMARLRAVVVSLPRSHVVTETDTYLHVECTSRLFRFVDDVEFLLDREARVIHCRSASRSGHSDLGVNRRRIEEIRRTFTAENAESAETRQEE
jgi:uncharacterized protein (DUF1499 family)